MNFSTLSMTAIIVLLLVGFGIGVISGMVGIGGGLLVIPVLMFFFGFSQARANGTSLAMLLPPIGIFAVLAYNKGGNIDWRFAILLGAGFAVGAYIGAMMLNKGLIHPTVLRISFAFLLIFCAARILFHSGSRSRSALETTLLIVAFAGTYTMMRLLARRWQHPPGGPPDWGAIYRAKQREAYEFDYEI